MNWSFHTDRGIPGRAGDSLTPMTLRDFPGSGFVSLIRWRTRRERPLNLNGCWTVRPDRRAQHSARTANLACAQQSSCSRRRRVRACPRRCWPSSRAWLEQAPPREARRHAAPAGTHRAVFAQLRVDVTTEADRLAVSVGTEAVAGSFARSRTPSRSQVIEQYTAGKNGDVPVQDGETFAQRLQRVSTHLNGFTAYVPHARGARGACRGPQGSWLIAGASQAAVHATADLRAAGRAAEVLPASLQVLPGLLQGAARGARSPSLCRGPQKCTRARPQVVCGITSTPHGVEEDTPFVSVSTPMFLGSREDDLFIDPALDAPMELSFDRPFAADENVASAFATTRPQMMPSQAGRSMLGPLSPTVAAGDSDARLLGALSSNVAPPKDRFAQQFRLSSSAADLMERAEHPSLVLHSPEHPARPSAAAPRRDGDEAARARGVFASASNDMDMSSTL
jgi:hypothetical protein